jgi:nitrite reductase (NADH) small subunit/3-phenylpropionate/trans-cinnamate dioxygenase ferredoxin subunit
MQVRVLGAGDLAPGEGREVDAGGRALALFNVGGRYYAIDNMCPHRGGPLGGGDLDGTLVSCPWHAWRWDIATGANANNPALRIACFPVIETSDGVFVELA